jgi:hypothetical protein
MGWLPVSGSHQPGTIHCTARRSTGLVTHALLQRGRGFLRTRAAARSRDGRLAPCTRCSCASEAEISAAPAELRTLSSIGVCSNAEDQRQQESLFRRRTSRFRRLLPRAGSCIHKPGASPVNSGRAMCAGSRNSRNAFRSPGALLRLSWKPLAAMLITPPTRASGGESPA